MQKRKDIGLAIIGCGTIGRIRAEIARAYPGIGWIGLCDLKSDIGGKLAQLGNRLVQSTAKKLAGKFFTTFSEILDGPE